MRVLLTGSSGFIGRHILESFGDAGLDIFTATRSRVLLHPKDVPLGDNFSSHDVFRQALAISKPHVVIHSAGVTHAVDPTDFFTANTVLAANLLAAVSELKIRPRVMFIGSAAEYGIVPDYAQPVMEDYACLPIGEYGISKYAQTLLARSALRRGIETVVVRLFNPVGCSMPPGLSLPSFARRIAAATPHCCDIRVGNLDVARDFIDINEVVRIMLGIVLCPRWELPIVNICSGVAISMASIIERMIDYSGKSIRLVSDSNLRRDGEMKVLCGSIARLKCLGFSPSPCDFEKIAKMLVDEATDRLKLPGNG